MIPGELKPILTALVLPPAGPLLLLLLGLVVATRRKATGLLLAFVALSLAWASSTMGVALALSRVLLPEVVAVQPEALRPVQAIVVLGGGVVPQAAEYGVAQPGPHTLHRIRYGVWLARQTGKPLAFAGGLGWAAAGVHQASEGGVARRVLQEEYGLQPRWVDDRSRDTSENAARMAELLAPERIRHIALVTDATHMERAAAAFRAAGFQVLPAPTHFPVASQRDLLLWLPSASGVEWNRQLVREWLARRARQAGAA